MNNPEVRALLEKLAALDTEICCRHEANGMPERYFFSIRVADQRMESIWTDADESVHPTEFELAWIARAIWKASHRQGWCLTLDRAYFGHLRVNAIIHLPDPKTCPIATAFADDEAIAALSCYVKALDEDTRPANI